MVDNKAADTDGVMKMFTDGHPDPTKCGDFYNQMTGEAYDDFLVRINFTDPYKICDAISKPAAADG